MKRLLLTLLLVLLAGCNRGHGSSKALSHTPATTIAVLGRAVAVHYGPEVTHSGRVAASHSLVAAAKLLDRYAGRFDSGETDAIRQIRAISITQKPQACLGEIAGHSMRLSVGYIRKSSVAWVASLVGHEGQHALDAGHYSAPDAWKDEKRASAVQLAIGKKIGFSAAEIDYLEHWIHASRLTKQRHMQQGFPANCTP